MNITPATHVSMIGFDLTKHLLSFMTQLGCQEISVQAEQLTFRSPLGDPEPPQPSDADLKAIQGAMTGEVDHQRVTLETRRWKVHVTPGETLWRNGEANANLEGVRVAVEVATCTTVTARHFREELVRARGVLGVRLDIDGQSLHPVDLSGFEMCSFPDFTLCFSFRKVIPNWPLGVQVLDGHMPMKHTVMSTEETGVLNPDLHEATTEVLSSCMQILVAPHACCGPLNPVDLDLTLKAWLRGHLLQNSHWVEGLPEKVAPYDFTDLNPTDHTWSYPVVCLSLYLHGYLRFEWVTGHFETCFTQDHEAFDAKEHEEIMFRHPLVVNSPDLATSWNALRSLNHASITRWAAHAPAGCGPSVQNDHSVLQVVDHLQLDGVEVPYLFDGKLYLNRKGGEAFLKVIEQASTGNSPAVSLLLLVMERDHQELQQFMVGETEAHSETLNTEGYFLNLQYRIASLLGLENAKQNYLNDMQHRGYLEARTATLHQLDRMVLLAPDHLKAPLEDLRRNLQGLPKTREP